MSDTNNPHEPAATPAGDDQPTTPLTPTPPPSAGPVPGPAQPPHQPQPAPPPTYPTGPVAPAPAPSFWRKQRIALASAAAALVIGGLIGGGIGWAVGDSNSHGPGHSVHAAAQERGGEGQSPERPHAAGRRGVAGDITAINGQTWTVALGTGQSVTVDLTSTTRFGTQRTPEQQSDFAVGDRVVVAGKRSGDTITARTVVKRATTPSAQPSGAGAPTAAQPG